jgi:hypothetical protein
MRAVLTCAMVLGALACGVGDPLRLDEPMYVPGGVFRSGELPGTPPTPDGQPPTGVPLVTAIDTTTAILLAGQTGRHLAGRASDDAYAVAVRFAEAGTGYFTVPVGPANPAFDGERDWSLELEIGTRIPSGLLHIEVVALDASGVAGPRKPLEVCVIDGAIPDDLSVCDPSFVPPAAAIVLRWDALADLDLVVTTPDGERVDARHPLTTSASDPAVGRFLRDSNAGCDVDGRNEEVLVWNEAPADVGAFLVGVDLFAACGTPGAHFEVTVLRREDRDDGTSALAVTQQIDGQLLALQADEGRRPPLYVTFVSF